MVLKLTHFHGHNTSYIRKTVRELLLLHILTQPPMKEELFSFINGVVLLFKVLQCLSFELQDTK